MPFHIYKNVGPIPFAFSAIAPINLSVSTRKHQAITSPFVFRSLTFLPHLPHPPGPQPVCFLIRAPAPAVIRVHHPSLYKYDPPLSFPRHFLSPSIPATKVSTDRIRPSDRTGGAGTMAVQAQYPSNALSADFRARARSNVQMLQDRNPHPQQLGTLPGTYSYLGQQQGYNNCTVFSDPTSELTCNASASRKRIRDEEPMALPHPDTDRNALAVFRYPGLNLSALPLKPDNTAVATTGARLSNQQSRLHDSAGTSTSGRPAATALPLAVSPLAQELAFHLYQQNTEIDALVRVQNERLRSGLEEVRRRYCRVLVSAVEQRVAKRLREKETELEAEIRRNAELEEKVRQMSAENQIWLNVAKNNEAIVNSLRTSLEQVLLQNVAFTAPVPGNQGCEGYGDSDGPATVFPADDAQSCCFEEERREAEAVAARENEELRLRRGCKACRNKDVCVLLLPCRHLCLCKACEPKIDACPICHSTKNASLEIFLG